MAQVSSIIKNKILDQNRYQRIDIIADNYRYTSNIKSHEQAVRGQSEKIEMKIDMMIPDNFKERILHNNENKQAFISLYFKYMQTNREETLKQFACSQIFLSAENECKLLTNEGIHDHNALASNQLTQVLFYMLVEFPPSRKLSLLLHQVILISLSWQYLYYKIIKMSPSLMAGGTTNENFFCQILFLNWMMTLDKP